MVKIFLFFAQKKIKNYPEKQSAQIFEKFTKKIKNCPVTESSQLQGQLKDKPTTSIS